MAVNSKRRGYRYRIGAERPRGAGATAGIWTARDEEEAYVALKSVKRRAARERYEAALAERRKVTLPVLKCLAKKDNE